jgi:hypothetical protein
LLIFFSNFINPKELSMEFSLLFLFAPFIGAMVVDLSVSSTSAAIEIGLPVNPDVDPDTAKNVLNELNQSGHSVSKVSDCYLQVIANRQGGLRPNLALWKLWKQVNDLAHLHGFSGFYFGDVWFKTLEPEQAQPKRLDWAAPPHMTAKAWWQEIAKQAFPWFA